MATHQPQQPSTHVNKPETDRRSVCDVTLFINDAFRFKGENITMELNLEKMIKCQLVKCLKYKRF